MNTASKASGIYAIVNEVNGKRYIGSAVCFRERCGHHRNLLNKGRHHCIHLQRAWLKYGSEAFRFVVLEFVAGPFLLDIEQRYIDKNKGGYNIAKFADAPMRGRKASPETIAKMSAARTGRKRSPEAIARGADANRGRKHTPEARAKISAAKRGRPGPKHTPESRAKISASNRGKTKSPEHRAKLSAANYGKKLSVERREQMLTGWRRRRQRRSEAEPRLF